MEKVRVCSLDEVPDGGVKVFRIGGVEVLVFRRGKSVFAYDNRCPHMGFSLYLGELKGDRLRCGFHGEVFHLESGKSEGRVVKRPLVKIPIIVEGEAGGFGVYMLRGDH